MAAAGGVQAFGTADTNSLLRRLPVVIKTGIGPIMLKKRVGPGLIY
jgi:hypothetical protein